MVKRESVTDTVLLPLLQSKKPVTSSLWSSAVPPSYKTNPESMPITIPSPCCSCRLPGLCPPGENARAKVS